MSDINYGEEPQKPICMNLNDHNQIALKFEERTGENFNLTYKKYFPKLKSFLNNMVRDEEEAKDIACDAFLKSIKDIDGYISQKSNYSTWLFTIARNMMLQRLEKRGRFSPIDADSISDVYKHNDALIADNPTDNRIKEHNTIEKVELVKEAIKGLPTRNAEVITMRQFKNMAYQDIADFYQQNLLPFFKDASETKQTLEQYIKFDYNNYTFTECMVKQCDEDTMIMEWNQERMDKWEEQNIESSKHDIRMQGKQKWIRVPINKMQNIAVVVPLSTIKSQIRQSRLMLTEKLTPKFNMIDSRTMYD